MDYPTFISDALIQAAGFANTGVYPQAAVESVIADVECLLPTSRWATGCTDCNRREKAVKYLVAHRLTLFRQTGVLGETITGQTSGLMTGQLSSVSASQGSQSFSFSQGGSQSGSSKNWLDEIDQTPTVWGAQFKSIIGTRLVAIGFTS